MASYKDGRAKDIVDLGNHLYTKKRPIDGLHQEIAWQFCPDLASFTSPLEFGEDWGVDRMDGYPEQVSRELSNQFSSITAQLVASLVRTQTRNSSTVAVSMVNTQPLTVQ